MRGCRSNPHASRDSCRTALLEGPGLQAAKWGGGRSDRAAASRTRSEESRPSLCARTMEAEEHLRYDSRQFGKERRRRDAFNERRNDACVNGTTGGQ